MDMNDLIVKFSGTRANREKAIFSTVFIAGNRLQTIFDSHIPELSLKQFMLLSIARQSTEPMTFTQLGNVLGCSRQNIKKLAGVLQKKGFAAIRPSPLDPRALCICPTEKADRYFQNDFSIYQRELAYLFAIYSDEEVKTLMALLTKLYQGIDNLEEKASGTGQEEKRWKKA